MSGYTMHTTEATDDAVDHVLGNLWERGARELAVLDVSLDHARSVMTRQRDAGLPTLAIWVDDEPVLVAGLIRISDPMGMSTWFQATESFGRFAMPITRELRSQLGQAAVAYDLAYIEIASPCVHPRTGRWFESLGFTLDVNRYVPLREGSHDRLYRFERRFDRVLPQA